jgi:hypothetical protein
MKLLIGKGAVLGPWIDTYPGICRITAAPQPSVQTFTYSAARLTSCIEVDGISQPAARMQCRGKAHLNVCQFKVEHCRIFLASSHQSFSSACFCESYAGNKDQQLLPLYFPPNSHTGNQPTSFGVVGWGDKSGLRKMTFHSTP